MTDPLSISDLLAQEQVARTFDPNRPPNVEPVENYTDENIGYLPMPCPNCHRHRVEAWLRTGLSGNRFVIQWRCEKCRADRDWKPS